MARHGERQPLLKTVLLGKTNETQSLSIDWISFIRQLIEWGKQRHEK
jgi:hypothetical protein